MRTDGSAALGASKLAGTLVDPKGYVKKTSPLRFGDGQVREFDIPGFEKRPRERSARRSVAPVAPVHRARCVTFMRTMEVTDD